MLQFPKKPISIGEQWTVKSLVENGLSTIIETTYILKEVNKDDYLITASSKLASIDKDKYVNQNCIEM